MRREEFEHVIRAAAEIVQDEIIVVGSQAVLGQYPDAPDALLRSAEVDLFPRNEPDRAEEIDGAIGDGSRFHATFHYYAHGVGPETSTPPAGWEDRLIRVELSPVKGKELRVVAWCLEVHDLVLAKLARGSSTDVEFAEEAIRSGLAEPEQLLLGVDLMPESHRERTRQRLNGLLTRLDASRSRTSRS
jgi:hypothetical protein